MDFEHLSHEHVANMTSALGHDFIGFLAHTWLPQYSPPSLCEQSELQCFASGLRQMSAQRPLQRCHIRYANWLKIYGVQNSIKIKVGKEATASLKGRVFKIEISKVSGSALVAEICTDPHNRLLRRQHCSSLCSQSEGHEHVANMTNALGHDFVGFSVLVRHNIRPPSLCEQSELQCFAPGLRRISAHRPLKTFKL